MALVHYPAIPELNADLIVLQPRLFSAGQPHEEIEFGVRIAAPAQPDRMLLAELRDCKQPWALLSMAALEASHSPSAAMDRLRRLWQREDNSTLFRSLVLRNLILLMMQQGDHDQARHLLDLGMEAFPQYAELRWLSGALWLRQRKFTNAKHDGERAMALAGSPQWIGKIGRAHV